MPLVYIDNLEVGMVLAEDLFTPKNRFVLAEGSTLQANHLQAFRAWGVLEADITEDSLGEEYRQQQEALAQFIEQAESHLYRRFALNDIGREPLTTIYGLAVDSLAQALQKGWEPMGASIDVMPPGEDDREVISVAQLIKGDIELVSLPAIYSHIVDALNDPEITSQRLAAVISNDASLCVRLLKLVNSPFYGFSGKIDSVSRAISLLGTDELSGLALGVTVIRQFANIPSDLFDMDAFWRHSIRCGLYARILATHLEIEGTEKYFTGGLLHDIGRLIMIEQMPGAYKLAVIKGRDEHAPMFRVEQESLQTDHSIVGKLLSMRWRLPPALIRMIGGHHSPNTNYFPIEACLLHVADFLAHACGYEASLVAEAPPLQLRAWAATGLKEDMLAPTVRQVNAEFSSIVNIFFGAAGDD